MEKLKLKCKARELKKEMETRRDAKGSIKDIITLIDCRNKGDYTEIFKTKLYNLYPGEYCEYLMLLNYY